MGGGSGRVGDFAMGGGIFAFGVLYMVGHSFVIGTRVGRRVTCFNFGSDYPCRDSDPGAGFVTSRQSWAQPQRCKLDFR
jgi:hypothetical protein